jgi:Flp pilus assembly protein TadG
MRRINASGNEGEGKPMKERGQSLVEFAISLLILLYLLVGAVEFGVLFFQYVQLRDAAQEAALYGSSNIPMQVANPNTVPAAVLTEIEDRARSASGSPVDLSNTSTVDVSIYINDTFVWKNYAAQGSTTSACENNGIRVVVAYKHRIFMPFLAQILGKDPGDPTIPLSATVTDTILTPVCS